jgi:hypothetical protein
MNEACGDLTISQVAELPQSLAAGEYGTEQAPMANAFTDPARKVRTMTGKAALKLSFAPDDYLATWQLPSPKGGTFAAHGALTVEAGKPPKATAHGDFGGQLEEMAGGGLGFPQYVDAPVLTGSLSNGANVLLVNAQVSYWFPSQASIHAAAAIITLADVVSEEALFKQFDIQIGGLDAIAGVAPIKSTKFPTTTRWRRRGTAPSDRISPSTRRRSRTRVC